MAEPRSTPSAFRTNRIQPVSEEAERGVLGSALLEPERVLNMAIERGLSPEAFYVPAHRLLFETMLEMYREGQGKVDLLTVEDRLRSRNKLDAVGGAAFLEHLVDGTPTAAHAEYYIDLVYDRYILREIISCAEHAIELCYQGDQDFSTVLSQAQQAFFAIGDRQRSPLVPWDQLIKSAMNEIEMIFSLKRGVTGIPTGYDDLDNLLQGLHKGDMIVLAARPSMGKTSLALNIVENVARGFRQIDDKPLPVGVFSLEMSKDQLVKRMICSVAGVPSQQLKGYISKENHGRLMGAADILSKAPIYLDDTAGLEVDELRARARRMKQKFHIELLVVDYLQMLHCSRAARDGRQQEVAQISGSIKAMAKELDVPVLVLSQLSRAPEQRSETAKPRLSDLRESGAIEQDADVVLLLRRPCRYEEDPEHGDRTLAYVEVAKHRNGPTGTVKLNFDEDLTRFYSRKEGVDSPSFSVPVGGDA